MIARWSMKSLLRGLLPIPKWLRLWNPKHFVNPFYSPALAIIEATGEAFVAGFAEGFANVIKGAPIEITPETWAMMQRSYRVLYFFDEDVAGDAVEEQDNRLGHG